MPSRVLQSCMLQAVEPTEFNEAFGGMIQPLDVKSWQQCTLVGESVDAKVRLQMLKARRLQECTTKQLSHSCCTSPWHYTDCV